MSFNEQSPLDPSQVEDRRGRGGAALAIGGGGLGLVVVVVALLLGIDPSSVINSAPPSSVTESERSFLTRVSGSISPRSSYSAARTLDVPISNPRMRF